MIKSNIHLPADDRNPFNFLSGFFLKIFLKMIQIQSWCLGDLKHNYE